MTGGSAELPHHTLENGGKGALPMNNYAVWRGGQGFDISSIFDQIHPGGTREDEDVISVPSVLEGMNVDPRLHFDPLTHLARAVGDIDIRQESGREQPPHLQRHPLPPIRHLPLHTPNHLSQYQRSHDTILGIVSTILVQYLLLQYSEFRYLVQYPG